MRSNVYRIINNRMSQVTFAIIISLPFIDFLQLLHLKQQTGTEFHPAFAFFLTSSSRGSAAQILLFWFLPLYFLLLGSEDAIQDYKTGFRNIFISKLGRKTYFLSKLNTAFIVSSTTMLISLVINFILVSFFFRNGTFKRGLDSINLPNNPLFNFSMDNVYLAIFLFTIVCCILAGFAGALGASMSLFFGERKYTYIATFFIWFLLILREQSLMYLLQPFTEYGLNVLIPIFLFVLFILMIIPLIVLIYEVKYNEN